MKIQKTPSSQLRATIASSVKFNGKALHSGKNVSIEIKPSNKGGIIFKRVDITDKNNEITAHFNNVSDLTFNTSIQNDVGVVVSTTEHLMAALWCCGISDCIVEIDEQELPTLDGASKTFLFGLKTVEKVLLTDLVPQCNILEFLEIKLKDTFIKVEPYSGLCIDFIIDFSCKEVGIQRYVFDTSRGDCFESDISHAKTFALKKDYDYLKTIGYAQGGDEYNAILLDEDDIVNKSAITFADDFVRHKVLDFIGDIYTSGYLFNAKFTCYKSGHALTNQMLKQIFNS